MATIFPFRGIRYNGQKIKDLGAAISPPYDVISEKEEKQLRGNPYNIIHLELPQGANRYWKAAQKLNFWQKKKILVRDDQPLFYVYKQIFSVEGKKYSRCGFFVSLQIESWGKTVKPHEKTLSKPKEDRLSLLRACRTNISPIFGLFSDTNRAVQKILLNITKQEPEMKVKDLQNVEHQLWLIKDITLQRKIQKLLKPKSVFIADGHHRYEVSLEYAQEQQRENYYRNLMYLCPFEDKGLIILPTHRQVSVSKDFVLDQFLQEAKKNFTVKQFAGSSEMLKQVGKGVYCYGIYAGGEDYYLLSYKKRTSRLAVKLVHQLLINPVAQKIIYTKNASEAITFARQSSRHLAFFLPPTPIEAIKKVALTGQTMPQKSTYFYPKLGTGLVLHYLGDGVSLSV
ncbi:MAG: DUF1015 domain-containing protein [Elusimicrobiota bacterium]